MAKGGKGGGGSGGGEGPLTLDGGRRADTLTGAGDADTIWGRDGDDILKGMGGDDFIHGGNGNDIVIGDFGTLTIVSDGNAIIDDDDHEIGGDDRLFGGSGNDFLYGGGGNDELQGGDGLDYLNGGDGYDIALYSADDEGIYVTPDGAGGFVVDFGIVTPDGDGGFTFDSDGAPNLPTEHALNIEGIVGTYYNDVMYGANIGGEFSPDGFVNTFDGYYGNDIIYGGDGNDCIYGGGDDDFIYGLAGDDVLSGGSGNDMITPGTGSDYVDGGANSEWYPADHDIVSYYGEGPGLVVTGAFVPLYYSDGTLTGAMAYSYTSEFMDGANPDEDFLWNVEEIWGTANADTMIGDLLSGDDHFVGGDGVDTLNGGGGNDILDGGAEGDFIDGGDGVDTASYAGSGTGVTVNLSVATPQDSGLGDDAHGDVLSSIENLIGSDDNDTLTGDGNNNVLDGGGGNDVIDGGGGNDVIIGGSGADTLTGDLGEDTFLYFSASEGGDSITDFSGFVGGGGEGDIVNLQALGLDGGSHVIGSAIAGGFIFEVGNNLFVDLDGGGAGGGDDILIATFTDGGGGFTLADDVLV